MGKSTRTRTWSLHGLKWNARVNIVIQRASIVFAEYVVGKQSNELRSLRRFRSSISSHPHNKDVSREIDCLLAIDVVNRDSVCKIVVNGIHRRHEFIGQIVSYFHDSGRELRIDAAKDLSFVS